jgi:hypothetical protein
MNTLSLRMALLATVIATPALAASATTWTAVTAPAQSQITGGPWTLGTPAALRNVLSSPQAITDYCYNGTENFAANPTPTVMAPFYFPYIIGEGQTLYGFFDYRPSSLNETTVAAKTTDGGKTWTWLQDALQLNANTVCPVSNTAAAADAGAGHPFLLSFGGANFLYLLDRRGGHVDSDGLIVKRLKPTVSAPLNAKPPLNATLVTGSATSNVGIIAGWDFTNYATGYVFNNPLYNNAPGDDTAPAADLFTQGSPVAASAVSLGMDNTYACLLNGTTTQASGSQTNTDISSNTGSSTGTANEWRIRGQSAATLVPNPCNGWSLSAPQLSQGAQFNVDTTGVAQVLFQFDWDTTKQGVKNLQIQYTIDGSTWNNYPSGSNGVLSAVPNGYLNQVTADFSNAALYPGVGNNPKFGVRLVSVYDPALPAGSTTTAAYGVALSWAAGQQYAGATPGTGAVDQVYNNNSGNWRFANVKFFDKTKIVTGSNSAKTDYSVETTGLLNPDGILAVIPNSTPRKVLYVSKQLYSATVACPTTLQPGNVTAPAAATGNKANPDLDSVRAATTRDGIHFNDLGPVMTPSGSLLINGNDVTSTGLRYVAPNGSIVKFANGTLGLFFGAGNCQDGDSDGFHIVAYAESYDGGSTWTVINGYTNPIAAVSFGSAPTTAPVIGVSTNDATGAYNTNYWFGGRVYNPNAVYQNPNQISLIFSGYDVAYFASKNATNNPLGSYRTIGQVTLQSSNTLVP